MNIVEVNFKTYLGRGVKLFLTNGEKIYFKPSTVLNTDGVEVIVGMTDEGEIRRFKRNEIQAIIPVRKGRLK